MSDLFEDRTPKPKSIVKKTYRLYDQHHGSFVLMNNDTNKFLHRQIDKNSKSITYTEVPVEYATQFRHFAIPKILSEILNVPNSKIVDVEQFMIVVTKGKITLK